MTTIQFTPSSWNSEIDKTPDTKPQEAKYYTAPIRQQDSFEFQDYELEEVKKTRKKSNKRTFSQQEAYDRAKYVQCEAIIKRNQVAHTLERAYRRNYDDITSPEGNLITFDFESDNLGRGIMIECDRKERPFRQTTFIPDTNEIYNIEEINPNGKGIDKISFYNYSDKRIGVKKDERLSLFGNKTAKEIFEFEDYEPTLYKKDCKHTSEGYEGKEEYYFG